VLDGRKRTTARALVASSFAITLASVGLASSPADAKPTPESVKAKVQRLYHEAEVAAEQLNNATAQVKAATTTMAALNTDYKHEQVVLDTMRKQVAAIVVSQYQGQSLSAASQVALSGDPTAFIQGMNVMTGVNSQRADVLNQYAIELKRLELRRQAVQTEATALAKARAQVAKQSNRIKNAASQAKAQLASLQPKQAAAVVQSISGPTFSRSSFRVPAVSGMAAVAVRTALAQVGKPYVYGAAGPNAFDCSGLTMFAWGAAGVSLSHNSAAQMGEGTPVSESQLQPGDLVFYYSSVSHVGMYIGNGMIVNAENPSTGVVIVPLHSMPYVGAVRIG
jgi:cell wall-associated NlpC family hydrolase